jgi:formamidopyrimidine-DNA glycosylase
MPELPEVETMRRAILPAIGGVIAEVTKPKTKYRPLPMFPDWPKLKRLLQGQKITAVDRLGKRVVVRFESGYNLVVQPKMAGILMVGTPPSDVHVRVRLRMQNCSLDEIIYWDRRGLGGVYLWTEDELHEKLGARVLGPDAVGISAGDFRSRFETSSSEVKVALLDQKRIAGIGNLYASEILHQAQVNPYERCNHISKAKWARIHAATQSILIEAIRLEGSTLGDGTYLKSLDESGGYQTRLFVYDRANQTCLTCKRATIERVRQGQRSTFFCPNCQKRR